MSRGSARRGVLSVPFIGALLLVTSVFPSDVAAEGHYANPHHNCRVAESVPLPRHRAKQHKTPPAWTGWHLRNGSEMISLQGGELRSFNPASGAGKLIRGGLSIDHQIQAALDSSGLYTVTASRPGSRSTEAARMSGYDLGTYSLMWSEELFPDIQSPLLATPLVAGNKVVLAAMNRVVAVNSSNGREAWSRTLDSIVGFSPAMSGKTILLPTSHGIEALSLNTGKTLWKHPLDPQDFNPARPIVEDGDKIYVSLTNKTLSAIDLSDGSILWESPTLASTIDFRHPALAGDDGIYIPLYGGMAKLTVTGTVAWTKDYSFLRLRQISPAIVLTANAVFIGGADGLYAVSPDSGEVVWSEEGLGQVADIEYMDPDLVVVNSAGMTYVLSP